MAVLSSTFYDSNDTGLGGISASAGTLISFLDKVLVNGYNSTTLTSLTCSSSVVTATLNSHGYRDRQWVTISGATPSGYNGTWQIITGSTATNTFQFTITGSGLSAATGTLSCNVAPLGWSKPFSGTNLAVYRAPVGNRFYYRIDDTGTTTARIIGYESMTDVNTGINPFTNNVSPGNYICKCYTGSNKRAILWGNGSLTQLYIDCDTTNILYAYTGRFGDIISFKSGDPWCGYIASSSGGNSSTTHDGSGIACIQGASLNANKAGIVFTRSYTGVVGAVGGARCGDHRFSTSSLTSVANPPPGVWGAQGNGITPADGNHWIYPPLVLENYMPRAIEPGIYHGYGAIYNNLQIFPGTGAYTGKEFMMIYTGQAGNGAYGFIYAEISNTW
jgi:hypothetical protein